MPGRLPIAGQQTETSLQDFDIGRGVEEFIGKLSNLRHDDTGDDDLDRLQPVRRFLRGRAETFDLALDGSNARRRVIDGRYNNANVNGRHGCCPYPCCAFQIS